MWLPATLKQKNNYICPEFQIFHSRKNMDSKKRRDLEIVFNPNSMTVAKSIYF